MTDFAIRIAGRRQRQLAISAVAANTGNISSGMDEFDCWADVDCWIGVWDANTPNNSPPLGSATGYKIYAGNVITVEVSAGQAIYVIAGGAGTFCYHRTN